MRNMREKPDKIYYVHAGYVYSIMDKQEHFVTCWELARLYELNPRGGNVILVGSDNTLRGHRCNQTCMHLYPRYEGDYVAYRKYREHI